MGVAFTEPRRLEDGETLEGFRCGVDLVDSWAAERAPFAKKRGTAVVYVSYCGDRVAGFYSLSSHSIVREDVIGGWLKRNAPSQIPVVLMGMLGVDEDYKGMKLGSSLLRDAVLKAYSVAGAIGAKAFVVAPVDDSACSSYAHSGFKTIPGTDRMFVPLSKK